MPKLVQNLSLKGRLIWLTIISYARKDIEFAQRLHHELGSRNRAPWQREPDLGILPLLQ